MIWELDRAYRQTEYLVELIESTLCLRIGEFDPVADRQLRDVVGPYREWAIVTPFNPGSVRLCEEENRARLENFHRQLINPGYLFLHSTSRDPKGNWPDEPGALILDMPLESVKTLARELGQNAIVHGLPGHAPGLVWIR